MIALALFGSRTIATIFAFFRTRTAAQKVVALGGGIRRKLSVTDIIVTNDTNTRAIAADRRCEPSDQFVPKSLH